MKKQTKKAILTKEKAKTKASKEQLQKFKLLFSKQCETENKEKMNQTLNKLSENKA